MKTSGWFRAVLTLAVIAGGAGFLRADIITLKSGEKYSGTMVRDGNMMTIKTDDGKVITARPDDIAAVTLTSTVTPAEAAASEWSRITQAIKTADDLQTVIDLHKKFLEKYPTAAQAGEVQSSLEVYQKLAESKAVKFRGRWMPPAQVEVVMKQWSEDARSAVDLYKSGRMKEALDAVKPVITADDKNPDALTVAGLASYRMNALPQARGFFISLAGVDAGSVQAENNLAVVASQMNSYGEEVAHYIKAIQLRPDNRLLLDNITDALNGFANGPVKNPPSPMNLKNLQKLYDVAEARMETAMAKKGLYRFGSTWVTKEQQDALQKNVAAIKTAMSDLDAKYKAVSQQLAAIDSELKQVTTDYDNAMLTVASIDASMLQAGTTTRPMFDVNSLLIQRNLASQNASVLGQRKTALEAQRAQITTSSPDFFKEADKLKAALAAAQAVYSGGQKIMDLGEADNPPPPAGVNVTAAAAPVAPTVPVAPATPVVK